ncbi:MAG: PAS domain-containing sensor histidine kinase [Candidatus Omnitrophota bacterium]|jgi:PAS domain S-box-containing protein
MTESSRRKIAGELSKRTAELAQANEELRRNEEKYRVLVEDVNSIILRMDTEGRVIFFNEFAQNFFGYKEEEILGKSVIGTIVPSTGTLGQDLKAMIGDIMLNPRKYLNNENENMLRSGQRVWISWSNRPILDKEKRLKEVLCVGNDITKLKEASEERFESVIENLSEGIISCNLDWRIKYANIAARKYLGIRQAEERSLAEIIFDNYSVSISREELLDFSVAHKEFDIVRRESEGFKALYLEADANVLKDPRGDTENIIMLFRNVTEARKEEILKQDFLSLISHKLSTPTNTINQSALLLQEGALGNLTGEQKECIDGIMDKTFQLKSLVANLLTFTTINSKELDFRSEPIQADIYLKELLDSLIRAAREKKVEFNINCSGKGIVVNISRKYLDLIIFNLVDNAVKFNDKEAAKITIGISRVAGRIEVCVTDNGPGIPPEEYDKIFEKFYQIEKYFTGNISGAGLGLPLVKRLVSGYGGSIRVESVLGKGSKFIISLPSVEK